MLRTGSVLLIVPLLGIAVISQRQSADLVLLNGNVITVDPRGTMAQAVAIKEGRVAFVGSTVAARKYVGRERAWSTWPGALRRQD